MPKTPGTINGYVLSTAWFRGLKFNFNGTTLDLARSLKSRGARIGETVEVNTGGKLRSNARTRTIVADGRDLGIWVA